METYLSHAAGDSVNPDSYFLRFPEKPDSRIIALPAYLGGRHNTVGIKWIGSFPANITRGIPRASAVLVLNDYSTGYPFALLEESQISAARTAVSAVRAAEVLTGGRAARRLVVVGAGTIARNILEFLAAQEVLDLAVGALVYRAAQESGKAVTIADFFGETKRW